MDWLPAPADFRHSLKSALAIADAGERLEALAALAQFRLGFIETIQLDGALKAVAGSAAPGFARVRLALLGSATVDQLLPGLRVAGLRRRLLIETYAGSFGQYRQELFDPASGLHAFAPQVVLLALSCRETVAAIPLTASAEQAQGIMAASIAAIGSLWQKARESFDATVIQQSFLDVTEPIFGSFDALVPGAPARIVAGLNDLLLESVARDGVLWLDLARHSARDGLAAWFDTTRWLHGKLEIAPTAAALYGELVVRLIAAQRGLSRKCLVLDLDNTLWGGVVGDVGLAGIVLGEGSAAGEAHLALQRYAKALKERGIILAVCSKNEASTAEEVFERHPEMALRRADISAFVANWTDKAENLRSIAEQLNIGLDSLVFVDDNPAERARVRESLPMVAVPELPDDPAHYVRCIAEAGYFEAVSFTDEDRQRVGQYAANSHRESLRNSMQSIEDYLRGLEMTVLFGPVSSLDVARATQLINKTNQFNTTTRRMSSEELTQLAGAASNITLQFRLIDRFGDNGLVSVMILRQSPDEPDVMELSDWVMSCRVFGRQLEDESMNIAVEMARERGMRALRAEFIATKKNGVIANLYGNLGFVRLDGPAAPDTSRWMLDLAQYSNRTTFIQRRANA